MAKIFKVTTKPVYTIYSDCEINMPILYSIENNHKKLEENVLSFTINKYAHLSFNTNRVIVYDIRYFYKWCEENKISPIYTTAGDLSLFNLYLRNKGLKPSTVEGIFRNVENFLNFANEKCGFSFQSSQTKSQIVKLEDEEYKISITTDCNIIGDSNKRNNRKAVIKVDIGIPTDEEVYSFLEFLEKRNPFVWGIVYFSAFTSLRLSEVLQFTKKQADEAIEALKRNEDYWYFYTRKGNGASRNDIRPNKPKSEYNLSYEMIEKVILRINSLRENHKKAKSKGYFFVSASGTAFTRENFTRIYKELRTEHGFNYTFHRLRNFVLDTVSKKDGLLVASKIAKHKNTSTTLGYTKDFEREQKLESVERFRKIISPIPPKNK